MVVIKLQPLISIFLKFFLKRIRRKLVDKASSCMVSCQKCSDGGQLSPWRDVRAVEGTGLENRRRASVRGFESHSLRHFFKFICHLQKYPRGRRGSPAKGVGWIKPARGFKSLLLRHVGAKSALLRRSFIFAEQKNVIRPLPCSSFPNRIRYAGSRFGLRNENIRNEVA